MRTRTRSFFAADASEPYRIPGVTGPRFDKSSGVWVALDDNGVQYIGNTPEAALTLYCSELSKQLRGNHVRAV